MTHTHTELRRRYEADPEKYDVWAETVSDGWIKLDGLPAHLTRHRYHLVPKTHRDAWQAWLDGELEEMLLDGTWRKWPFPVPPAFAAPPSAFRRKPKLAPVATEFAAKTAAVRAAADQPDPIPFIRTCLECNKLIGKDVPHTCRPKPEPEWYDFYATFSKPLPWPHWEPLPDGSLFLSLHDDWRDAKGERLGLYRNYNIRIPRTAKPPMPGEWWLDFYGSIVRVVGQVQSGQYSCEGSPDVIDIEFYNREELTRWLPDCTGFDYEVPK